MQHPTKPNETPNGNNDSHTSTHTTDDCTSTGHIAASISDTNAEGRPQNPYNLLFDTQRSYANIPRAAITHPPALSHRETSNLSGTTVDSSPSDYTESGTTYAEKMRRVKKVMEQCEAVGWPFRKKLILSNLNLRFEDVPVERICSDKLGPSLQKLSLVGNHFLSAVPDPLVVKLVGLRTLDLSKCNLRNLPEIWDLPLLKKLNLGRNKLSQFPNELVFRGIPMLEQLELEENKLSKITLPHDLSVLSKLEYLDVNLNKITVIPDEISQLHALKTIRCMNNSIEIVPEAVCEMDLRVLDVSSNPLIQPPLETCERGIFSMRRYYNCLRVEEHMNVEGSRVPEHENGSTSKGFIKKSLRPKSRKKKSFPASLCRSNMFRSVSEPSATLLSAPDGLKSPRSLIHELSRSGSLTIEESDKNVHSKTLSTRGIEESSEQLVGFDEAEVVTGDVAINDTLKVIFVGMALSGKTSIIKRLIEGEKARIPHKDDRTIGVDIYQWKPSESHGLEKSTIINTKIEVDEDLRSRMKDHVDVKFSVWDFAGQHVYHATHELFFSNQALYVLVWDMGANNPSTMRKRSSFNEEEQGAFKLTYDSSDEECGDLFDSEQENRRIVRALEQDIDEKLNFWVECIQASAPGAAILPVASFDDYFSDSIGNHEASIRCKLMKERLLKHEKRRIEGMKKRLAQFQSEDGGPVPEASIVQKLLCPLKRPKLIFGIDGQDVVRVSSKNFTGFDRLAAGIVNVATGRERGGLPYPVFRGHIGARIPRMRLEVRDLVRDMRERFKVVESGYFLCELAKRGIDSAEDVSDALHFLTNVGELSYFGEIIKSGHKANITQELYRPSNIFSASLPSDVDICPLRDDDSSTSSSLEKVHQYSTGSSQQYSGYSGDSSASGLDEFIFLNPRWLVAAVACILRHDLTREIHEVRRLLRQTGNDSGSVTQSFNPVEVFEMLKTDVNYPVISSQDVRLLWETKRFTKKAAERALQYSNNRSVTPFEFLQRVLVRFGVFVPIDLTIDRACLGGKDYTRFREYSESFPIDAVLVKNDQTPEFFFLPSLLGPEEPYEIWTFKTAESWKTTLCHTVLFPDGAPPGLMERLTSFVLNDLYTISSSTNDGCTDLNLRLKETLCWRSAFFLKTALDVVDAGNVAESIVEIFVTLVDQESNFCVASESMGIGMRRLVFSARGQAGDHGSKIWKGGYKRVIDIAKRYIMREYGGLEFEFQYVCPQCLLKRPIAQVGVWNSSTMLSLAEVDPMIRCRYGHGVDIRLLTALQGRFQRVATRPNPLAFSYLQDVNEADDIPISELLKAVVLVGVWDEFAQRIVRAGSGFFVDKKRGFVVTAAHTLLDNNTWREIRGGKIVIGVIPTNCSSNENVAVYRYFARIIAKDPSINEKGCCTLDACVLQITTRMENDVFDSGKEIGEQPERLLMNSPDAMKREKFKQLSVSDKVELDETIRILGFNQGGEGLIESGDELNRCADFARGYVVMKFATTDVSEQKRFQPRSEIVVICPTIGGHSGGPCVNQQGEVIGILSRADPADKQRCYLVPTSEFNPLVKEAKRVLSSAIM